MGVKRFTVSFPEYVYNKYLSDQSSNRSKFIEEMFVRGIEAETGELKDFKTKYIGIVKELRDKDDEIKKLSMELGKFKELHKRLKERQNFLYDDKDKCANCGGFIQGKSHKFPIGNICGACFMNAHGKDFKRWGDANDKGDSEPSGMSTVPQENNA